MENLSQSPTNGYACPYMYAPRRCQKSLKTMPLRPSRSSCACPSCPVPVPAGLARHGSAGRGDDATHGRTMLHVRYDSARDDGRWMRICTACMLLTCACVPTDEAGVCDSAREPVCHVGFGGPNGTATAVAGRTCTACMVYAFTDHFMSGRRPAYMLSASHARATVLTSSQEQGPRSGHQWRKEACGVDARNLCKILQSPYDHVPVYHVTKIPIFPPSKGLHIYIALVPPVDRVNDQSRPRSTWSSGYVILYVVIITNRT